MDRLKAMQTFSQVAATGSFSKSAKLLALSRGAVSRHISDLEAHLNVQLIHRNTRHVNLTELGEQYFRACTQILRDVETVERSVAGMQAALLGTIKVVCKRSFGMVQLSQAVADFSTQYPEISVSLVLDDQLPDAQALIEDRFDVAIRISPVADSAMVSRKIAVLRWIACASPQYLEKNVTPLHPTDLTQHNCLHHLHKSLPSQSGDWHFKGPAGPISVRVTGGPSANSVICLKAAALAGLGIALLPTYCIGPDIAAGRLVPILDAFKLEDRTLHAIYPPGGRAPRKVTTFLKFLLDRYRDPPWDAH